MDQKKNIIIDYGWYSHHLLIEYHRGNVYFDKKIIEADIIDGIVKEWWVDNTTRYSFHSLQDIKTFRGYLDTAKECYYLIGENPKDKTIIVFTNSNEWWELLLRGKEFYSKKIKTDSDEFELIFKVLYFSKYNQWIKLDISLDNSITKKMKVISEYLR